MKRVVKNFTKGLWEMHMRTYPKLDIRGEEDPLYVSPLFIGLWDQRSYKGIMISRRNYGRLGKK